MSLGRSFLRLISGDSSAGGHSSETAPMGWEMSSARVLCHVQRYEGPKHSQCTALTSDNPQLQTKVRVSTAALELAYQRWGIKKKKAGDHDFWLLDKRLRISAAEHEQVQVARLQELCRDVEFIHQEEEWWICPGTGTERGGTWLAGRDKAGTVLTLSQTLHNKSFSFRACWRSESAESRRKQMPDKSTQ